MTGLRPALLWIAVPIVLFLGLEMAARWLVSHSQARFAWYEGADERFVQGQVDYLFIGTSRTATGVMPGVWESEIEKGLGHEVVCLNLGRAYSGPVANYFGLRELMRRHPESMRNCTVLIEMSAGLPGFSGSWSDPWFYEGNNQLIVDYMNWSDLRRFLREPQHGFEDKAGIIARFVGRGSTLISARRKLQQTVEWRGMTLVRSVLNRLGAREASSEETDLPQNRQLRRDLGGIRLQRELVQERIQPEELESQKPLAPWESRVICEAAANLRRFGVRVVFFDVPVPAYQWTVNGTPTRIADRDAFARWAKAQGIPSIESGIRVADEDFPDLSHLRASRVEEYTRALARSYIAEERMPVR